MACLSFPTETPFWVKMAIWVYFGRESHNFLGSIRRIVFKLCSKTRYYKTAKVIYLKSPKHRLRNLGVTIVPLPRRYRQIQMAGTISRYCYFLQKKMD